MDTRCRLFKIPLTYVPNNPEAAAQQLNKLSLIGV